MRRLERGGRHGRHGRDRRGSRDRRSRRDTGAVTAETAMVLPALVVVLVLLLWGLSVGAAHVQVIDASRSAARALARGEDPASVRAEALEAAPPGSVVELSLGEAQVTVAVRTEVAPPGAFGTLAAVSVSASATADREGGQVP
jgi:Flp pilus assembly protein TadG